MKQISLALVGLLIGMVLSIACAGCVQKHVSTQAQATIQQHQDKAAVDQADAEDEGEIQIVKDAKKTELKKQQGDASPLAHPIAAANNTIVKLRHTLSVLMIVCMVAWLAVFILSYTPFHFLNFLNLPLRWASILLLATVLMLPLAVWGFLGAAAAIVGLFAYELVKDHGNIRQAEADSETFLGIRPAPQSSVLSPQS